MVVSATNLGYAPLGLIEAFPLDLGGEIHLGGHAADHDEPVALLLIDNHGHPVTCPVWAIYAATIARGGPKPTLIEWDNGVPDWPVLTGEAGRASAILEGAT